MWIFGLLCEECSSEKCSKFVICWTALYFISFSIGSTLGVTFYLISIQRRQIFEKLQTLVQACLGVPGTGWAINTKRKQMFFFNWKRLTDCYWPFPRHIVGGYTFLSLAPPLGIWLCSPLQLFMGVNMIPNMWHSSRRCKLHSRGRKTCTCSSVIQPVVYSAGCSWSSGWKRWFC